MPIVLEVGSRAETERATYSDIDMMVVRDGKEFHYAKKTTGEKY